MASRNVIKKGVSKDDLKKLMKQMKTEGTIKHPLAKYNSLGHLICTVCNCQVKSDRLWNAHLLSRTHKEKVCQPSQPEPMVSKRVNTDSRHSVNAKRQKADTGSTGSSSVPEAAHKPKSILKNPTGIPLAGYSSSDDSSASDADEPAGKASRPSSNAQGLPADFFDTNSAEKVEEEEPMDTKPTESLPEGFFDDPKADAKARNIEYVDKDEAEWSKFQFEMKEEAEISEQIQAEDEYVNTEERHLEEIDEQLEQWSKVNNMVQQKQELMKRKMESVEESKDSLSDSEDIEMDEFLNWRTKKVIK